MKNSLAAQFGNIDIYVFDQLLRGRLAPGMTVLDCGCGGGRNIVYMLQNGFDVRGVDISANAIESVRKMASELAPELPAQNFRVEPVDAMSFADASADFVLCSTVLHFARDEIHFRAMLREMWRVLRPGGLFFARLASTIGMEEKFEHVDGRRFRLADGTVWFLVDAEMLIEMTAELGGEFADPIKTTVVHQHRCMTTWVVRKHR